VRVGFHIPQWGAGATRSGVLRVARAIEDADLDSVWVADHVVLPRDLASAYPYADAPPFAPEEGFLEALTSLAVVAGATERVMLGTSVLVLPQRETLMLAKVAATLDVLSGGRACLAVGAGWLEQEFDALGQRFAGRGKRMDEQIDALGRIWREGTVAYEGEQVRFDEVVCLPCPVPGDQAVGSTRSDTGIPLWVGGTNPAALRRVARVGDGWHALGMHAESLATGWETIRRHAADAGRDPATISRSTSAVLPDDDETALRRLIRTADVGIDHVVLDIRAPSADHVVTTIERFAERVLPRLREHAGRGSERGGER
jgi:probable F420-dependent oxidoreductase